MVPHVHGLVLTGGSAFGLDAVAGVMAYLEAEGVGFQTGAACVPIVPGAVIYDLGIGDAGVRPDAALGGAAARCASADGGREGSAGAGCGATVGKVLGYGQAVKGGIGMASAMLGSGHCVGAIAVVNAFGDIADPGSGRILAGARDPDGPRFADTTRLLAEAGTVEPWRRDHATPTSIESTTLVAVVTDLPLGKVGWGRVARMGHDGMARAVRPCHTQWDGDVVYALSTAAEPAPGLDGSVAGAIAADVVASAIVRGVTEAQARAGVPAVRDLAC